MNVVWGHADEQMIKGDFAPAAGAVTRRSNWSNIMLQRWSQFLLLLLLLGVHSPRMPYGLLFGWLSTEAHLPPKATKTAFKAELGTIR